MEETNLPQHVAIIMDGNRRWAEMRGLPHLEGHRAGVKAARQVIEGLQEHGIKYVTLYSFSTENWKRPMKEVSGLMRLLEQSIKQETRELHERNMRLVHLGRLEGLSPKLRRTLEKAVELTRHNTAMTVGVAFNYGGRGEIVDAVRRLVSDGVSPQEIDERLFSRYLYTDGLPEVDLVIRTGGEIRTSNFLIWQAAYAEYYFTPVLWPDFDDKELEKALLAYRQRQRRFGGP
ncbi:MAG: polyprenyl diphosphate synthase [Chloroflexota bacterium]